MTGSWIGSRVCPPSVAGASAPPKRDGRLFSFGSGVDGQLGLGGTQAALEPTEISGDMDWRVVESDYFDSVAIKSDGRLFSWGDSASVESRNLTVPTVVGGDRQWRTAAREYEAFVAIGKDGTLHQWEERSSADPPFRQIGSDNDWVQVATSDQAFFALGSDGRILAWGKNSQGQLGLGDRSDRDEPTLLALSADNGRILADGRSTFLIDETGQVYSWGTNSFGLLAQGNGEFRALVPTLVDLDWAVPDSDGDGVKDPGDLDDDNDRMSDSFERSFGLNPLVNDANLDLDKDGVSNLREFEAGTLPDDANSLPSEPDDGDDASIWPGGLPFEFFIQLLED